MYRQVKGPSTEAENDRQLQSSRTFYHHVHVMDFVHWHPFIFKFLGHRARCQSWLRASSWLATYTCVRETRQRVRCQVAWRLSFYCLEGFGVPWPNPAHLPSAMWQKQKQSSFASSNEVDYHKSNQLQKITAKLGAAAKATATPCPAKAPQEFFK